MFGSSNGVWSGAKAINSRRGEDKQVVPLCGESIGREVRASNKYVVSYTATGLDDHLVSKV